MEVLLFVAACAVAVWMVRWISRPIEALAQTPRHPTQFTVSDLLVLFALLQLAVGTVHYLVIRDVQAGSAETTRTAAIVFDAFMAIIVVLCWWCGASMVSRAGIQHWWHRALVLGFVAPCGIMGAVAVVVLMVVGLLSMRDFAQIAVKVAAIASAVLVVIGMCGAVTRWIAAKYPGGEPAGPLDAGNAASAQAKSTEE